MGSSKGLRSVYLAWVGEGVRIPGSRATNECIYEGWEKPTTCLGSWGCGARRATAFGVAESVRSGPDRVTSEAAGLRKEGDDKGMGICNYTNES